MTEQTKIIEGEKPSDQIRLVSFNVNGIKTFFQYHPFRIMNNSLDNVFGSFDADVITFQEMKTSRDNMQKYGKLRDYHSFITLSRKKLGYSGVGVWIRKITDKADPLYHSLQVVKAEEGITGYLEIPKTANIKTRPLSSPASSEPITYRDDANISIGGYEDIDEIYDFDIDRAIELDSQGRCIIVELSSNVVIFSCYCPANSMGTEEGELFRMQFLQVLFKRAENLTKMGKHVVIMGDINVCKDLIDSADSMQGLTKDVKTFKPNNDHMIQFINNSKPSRKLMNSYLKDSLDKTYQHSGFLYDSTRVSQGYDRMGMYTVWNTLLNTRQSNFGSRVDYIFVSDFDSIKRADILPQVLGSDHCPIFTDLKVPAYGQLTEIPSIPKLECKFYYKLVSSNILDMFSKRKITDVVNNDRKKKDMKPQINQAKRMKIDSFFKPKEKSFVAQKVKRPYNGLFVQEDDDDGEDEDSCVDIGDQTKSPGHGFVLQHQLLGKNNLTKTNTQITQLKKKTTKFSIENSELGRKILETFGHVPKCNHGENAVLRTSKTQNNFGKKFWICGKPRGTDPNDPTTSCGFFKWV